MEQVIQSFRQDADLLIETHLITDFDSFAAEVEDYPAYCESIVSPKLTLYFSSNIASKQVRI